jgi:hypothetical protein
LTNPSIEAKRLEALKEMSMVNRLTDEIYFADFLEAIETENEELWMKTSEKAGIPKEKARHLMKVAKEAAATPGIVWFVRQKKRPEEERKLK